MPATIDILKPRKITGRIERVLTTQSRGRLRFETAALERLDVDLEGIVGNRHRGWTRGADARVPYLPRGAIMRNDRHVSVVSVEDLVEIARRLEIPHLDPAWIGANLLVSGIPTFSFLPRGTHLVSDQAILTITDQNAPCILAGQAIARHVVDRPEIKLQFPALAQGLRGVVAVVEHPGTMVVGSTFEARLPAQWLYV